VEGKDNHNHKYVRHPIGWWQQLQPFQGHRQNARDEGLCEQNGFRKYFIGRLQERKRRHTKRMTKQWSTFRGGLGEKNKGKDNAKGMQKRPTFRSSGIPATASGIGAGGQAP